MKSRVTILILFSLIRFSPLFSQSNSINVEGKVIEKNSKQPLGYATVKILDPDSLQLISGTTSGMDGNFTLTAPNAEVLFEISFIGFEPVTINDFKVENGAIMLGVIELFEDTETLDEVVIRGEKSQTVFKLDKRVFNVGEDLSSTGASALEVLNNVPSVTVNIEGQIRLRGSAGVQILINGKPSVLASEQGNALGTLTADMIESIEVITNPSAKYDAEGTAGIINIILKKEEKKGLNGSVTLNTGVPNNHSFGLSLNNRTEKFNLFSQLGLGHRTFPTESETVNRDLVNNTSIISTGDSDKNESFFNLILGTDYHLNSQNVITLAGHFAYEWETEYSDTDFSSFNADNTLVEQWHRDENTEATNPKYQYEFQYQKNFADHEDHTLLFSALGSYFGKDQSSQFNNTSLSDNLSLAEQQQTDTDFKEGEYTFKLDYVHPVKEKITLEGGAQYVITAVTNDFSVSNLVDNDWIIDPALTNIFDYNQKVMGIYGTGAYEGDKVGIKVGLRLENTDLQTVLLNTQEENQQLFTNLFPTIHSSYKIYENFSLQAGYSRRINRPGLWDLNPFTNIRNNFSIRAGNPLLEPEFTDSYEFTGIYDQGAFSLNGAIYHRFTTNVVEAVTTFENNISFTRPANIGSNRTTGLEMNAKYNPVDWWSLNGDFNYNFFQREGSFEANEFDFNAEQWTGRLTTKIKLPLAIDFEATGNYRSSFQTFQRIQAGYFFVDLGLRKKLMKGKTILNLSIRDVFASRIFESETMQPTFYLSDYRLRGRFITLGISYGFGKGEAMEFGGQKRF